jgi:hypothetical protein
LACCGQRQIEVIATGTGGVPEPEICYLIKSKLEYAMAPIDTPAVCRVGAGNLLARPGINKYSVGASKASMPAPAAVAASV